VPLTYKDVADIIKIIDASKLEEVVIEIDGARIHIRRGAAGTRAVTLPTAATPDGAPAQAASAAATPPKAANISRKGASAAAAQVPAGHAVRSPMVGTFYRAPSPQDPPFVDVGSVVKRGDPLCLIEVMKLFTTITADRDGRITHILPANGDAVEFDQVLLVIEPT
jgi:acetyl-CoA carboxylase biotin carboxyl carrier protein